jgi:uroporphyrinogen-III synthase
MENSPYQSLVDRTKVKIDFRSFIHVEGVSAKEVREQKVDLTKYTAIILTSRNSVDHFFRVAEEMRFKIPDTLKYFCQSEAVAYYLQKYVVYRKRKIYVGKRSFSELIPLIKKHKNESFLCPNTDKLKDLVPEELDSLGIKWKSATFFKTVISDLSDLADVKYDVLVFFSPSGIDSLFQNFPGFIQDQTRIAVYGNTTSQAAKERGLRIDIQAPTPESPSMTMAIENYIKTLDS